MPEKNIFVVGCSPFGGQTNVKELAELCPQEFKERSNLWKGHAIWLKCKDDSYIYYLARDWVWKSEDRSVRSRQLSCLLNLVNTKNDMISRNDISAVVGWMLSEMLNEVPNIVPTTQYMTFS